MFAIDVYSACWTDLPLSGMIWVSDCQQSRSLSLYVNELFWKKNFECQKTKLDGRNYMNH